MLSDRFLTASSANIVYNPRHVSFYQLEDSGNKIKLHFISGETKDIQGSDVHAFLAEIQSTPISPSQAA
ncbi:MAG: hypothetical protein ACRD1F_10945 [Terriglobales bacterium]